MKTWIEQLNCGSQGSSSLPWELVRKRKPTHAVFLIRTVQLRSQTVNRKRLDSKCCSLWAGEIAPQVTTLSVLKTDLSSVASTHMVAHNCPYLQFEGSNALWSPWAPGIYVVYKYIFQWNAYLKTKLLQLITKTYLVKMFYFATPVNCWL